MGGRREGPERETLLAAARDVLTERGYDGLRVDDVLQRAGLSTRAFYRHFSGKAALYLELFESESVQANDRLRELVEGAPTPAARVRTWVRSVLALAYDDRLADRAKLFAGERGALARRFPDEIDRMMRRQLAPLEEAIADGRAAGVFPDAHPANDARAIHHLCSGLIGDRLEGSTSLSQDEAVELASRFALTTLQAGTPSEVTT